MELNVDEIEVGLSARVVWRVDPEKSSFLLAGLPLPGLLNRALVSEQVLELRLTGEGGRIDFLGSSLYGNEVSLIRRKDGTTICLSHADQSFVTAKAEEIKTMRFERPLYFSLENEDRVGEQMEVLVHLHDPSTGRDWRQHLWLEPRTELRGFAPQFFELLFGDRQVLAEHGYDFTALARLFEAYGFPVRASLDLIQVDGSATAISSFSLEDLRLYQVSPEDLDPPVDYLDARDQENWDTLRQRAPAARPVRVEPDAGKRPFLDEERPSGLGVMIRKQDDWGNDPKEPDLPDDPLPAITYESKVALQIEQALLDDITWALNDILAPFSGVETAHGVNPGVKIAAALGVIYINWLAELKNNFLGCLMHEDTSKQTPETFGGGLLDRQAARVVPWLFDHNQYPHSIYQLLPQSMQTEIANKADYWGALPANVRQALTTRYAARYGGTYANAVKSAQEYFNKGTYDEDLLDSLPEEMKAAIAAGGQFWQLLNVGTPARLVREFVEKVSGVSTLYYPQSIEGDWPEDDQQGNQPGNKKKNEPLLHYKISDLQGSLTFPLAVRPAPSPGSPQPPLTASVFGPLTCNLNGTIGGSVNLGDLSLSGQAAFDPTALYWTVLNGGYAVLMFLCPAFVWGWSTLATIAALAAVSTIYAQIDISDLRVDPTLSWKQPRPSQPFSIQVDSNVSCSTSVSLSTLTMSGLFQITILLAECIVNHTSLLIDEMKKQIDRQLEGLLAIFLGGGFPAWADPLVPVLGADCSGVPNQSVTIEAALGAPTYRFLQITPQPAQANPDLRTELSNDLARLKATASLRGRHYFSLGANVNALNQAQAVLWDRGDYTYLLNSADRAQVLPPLIHLLAPAKPIGRALITPACAPWISLTGSNAAPYAAHCQVHFDRMLLELRTIGVDPTRYCLLFSVQNVAGYYGLGRPAGPAGTLSLFQVQPQLFDLYLDLSAVHVDLISLSEISITTITVDETGLDSRRPWIVTTTTEKVEQQINRPISPADEAALKGVALNAFVRLCYRKRSLYIPQFDGINSHGANSGNPKDHMLQQSYALNAKDPDDLAPTPVLGLNLIPIYVPVDLGIATGNLFAHGGPQGLLRKFLDDRFHLQAEPCSLAQQLYSSLDF